MEYLHWHETTITDFSEKNVAHMYANGYVFTRIGKGVMHQTRSVRVDLSKFELSSENRRILKKVGERDGGSTVPVMALQLSVVPFAGYDFTIGKLAKDFYEEKFGSGIMSAQKVKEMLTEPARSNFNLLLRYTISGITTQKDMTPPSLGYAIAYENPLLLHYSYPFYDLKSAPKDMGLGMMIMAIEHAKAAGKKYAYLGSLQRPGDTYKLQFSGLEWYDGGPGGSHAWRTDLEMAKEILKHEPA